MKRLYHVKTKANDVELTTAYDIDKLLRIKFDHAYCVVHIPELDPHGLVLIAHQHGLQNGLECNNNLYPFFYVGDCYIVDKDFNGLTDEQITFINTWFEGLKHS